MAVLGIGGLFIRSKDPTALAAWYSDTLGIGPGMGPAPRQHEGPFWWPDAGPLVFQPFEMNSDYFRADHNFMLNLRVDDLDGMLTRFAASGVEVETRAEWDDPGYGRFARLHDPDGNPIELWQPPMVKKAD